MRMVVEAFISSNEVKADLAKLSKSLALSPSMVDLPCKTLEVASPEPEDGGGNLHALQWGLTYQAKRSRSLALSPIMLDLPCKTLEVASPEPEDGGVDLHVLLEGTTYLAKRSRSQTVI
jgi:hypothetical protein